MADGMIGRKLKLDDSARRELVQKLHKISDHFYALAKMVSDTESDLVEVSLQAAMVAVSSDDALKDITLALIDSVPKSMRAAFSEMGIK